MASNDLKRVGLVFKADGTADFVRSLKSTNNELKQNYENFKLTQAQYDKNTTSMDKLKDKYEYLGNAIDSQTKKVTILEEQLKELENAENRDEQAIEKKRIALTQAQTSLERYKNQSDEVANSIKAGTANIEDFADKLNSSSEKITSTGKKLSIVSAVVGGIGVAGLKTAADFEEAMSSVKAISGATGDDFQKLKEKAEYMGATTKFTATESANAMYYMALAGWKTQDMLDGLEGIMYLAAASGEDLAMVSDIVTDGLTALGYAADQSTHYADVFAKTVTNSNSTVETLGEAMKYVGPIAGALNISVEDTATALGLMANAGVKSSQAGTSLRGILQRLATNTSGARDEMESLGVKIFDQNGKMRDFGDIMNDARIKLSKLTDQQKTSLAKTVAGTTAMSGFLAIVNSSDADFEKLTNAINDCDGAAKKMSEIMIDNAKGQLTIIKSQLEGIAIQLSQYVFPFIKSILSLIQTLLTKLSELSPTQQKILLIVTGLIIALGPLLIVIGKIGTGISSLISAFKFLGPLLSGAKTAVAGFTAGFNPVILIIAAVAAAVVGIGYLIYKNWDDICSWTRNLADNISAIWNNITEFFKNLFSTDWTETFGLIGNLLNGVYANIENFINAFKEIFKGIITFIKGVFTGDWKMAWEGVKSIFKGVFDLLYSIAVSPLNMIISAINLMISGLNKIIEGINKIKIPDWDWLGSLAGKGFNIPTIKSIAYLASGGELLRGTAIVGEAGPEILTNNGGNPKVVPLNKNNNDFNILDYEKLFKLFLKALNSCKLKLDRDGFIRFIDDRLNEVI
ncbi:phage tail tape measure protein TP901 family core region [Firmicutes bacterium CAG:460]|nr:phage tail tape measure protein TP901 family core region [Firmicutes bacterium CAG:460]